ncbi:MAG: hypothetical protein WCT99_14055 [Bacteroidota bacterium]
MNWIEELSHDFSSISSSTNDLKKFGWTIGGVFLFLAAFAQWKGWWGEYVVVSFAIAGFLLVLGGFLFPGRLLWLHAVWMSFAIILGSVVSRIILFILFFAVLTPIAFLARITGKKFFSIFRDRGQSTYWVERDRSKKINYEQMF